MPDSNYNDVIRDPGGYSDRPTAPRPGPDFMTDPTSAEFFLQRAAVVDMLKAYGSGIGDLHPDQIRSLLKPAYVHYMQTPVGRGDVAVWSNTFKETLADLAEFRSTLLHKPEAVSVAEIRVANAAVDRALDGLAMWLDSSPALHQFKAS
jgi:hypothetical protein